MTALLLHVVVAKTADEVVDAAEKIEPTTELALLVCQIQVASLRLD